MHYIAYASEWAPCSLPKHHHWWTQLTFPMEQYSDKYFGSYFGRAITLYLLINLLNLSPFKIHLFSFCLTYPNWYPWYFLPLIFLFPFEQPPTLQPISSPLSLFHCILLVLLMSFEVVASQVFLLEEESNHRPIWFAF